MSEEKLLKPQSKTYELYGIRLTKQEYLFLQAVRKGVPPAHAAAEAGYSNPASVVNTLVQRPHIRNAIDAIREELRQEMSVTREMVVDKLEEAYALARDTEDPGTMVRVCAELSKMFGFYAPEKKQIEQLPTLKQVTENDVAQMSDEQLIEMAATGDGVWEQLDE